MARVRSDNRDEMVFIEELHDPNVELDLTSDPWNLVVGRQASMLLGRDVIHPGRLAPDGGRKPIGSALDSADRPIIDAFGSGFFGNTGIRHRDIVNTTTTNIEYAVSDTSLQLLTGAAWPTQMLGGIIVKNGDSRRLDLEIRTITAVTKTTIANDTIQWSVGWNTSWAHQRDKFYIIYTKRFDKRGVWVTNGRKFWLLQGGMYTLYLDLGSDVPLGQRWDMVRIGHSLLLFVNPKYPARIIRLSDSSDPSVADNNSIAGLIQPKKTDDVETSGTSEEPDGNADKSWVAFQTTVGNLPVDSVYQVKVRAINIDEAAESRFVNAYWNGDLDDPALAITGGNQALRIAHITDDTAQNAPPLHERWTHIEIWRTVSDGAAFFLERRIEIAKFKQELASGTYLNGLMAVSPSNRTPCILSDVALTGQIQMTSADLLGGHPPPRCRRVENLAGVTVCCGAADEDADAIKVIEYSRNFYLEAADYDDTGSGEGEKAVTLTGKFANYTLVSGDELVITAPSTHVGVYGIADVGGTNPDDVILLSTSPGVDLSGTLEGYIRIKYEIDWPKIESDEDVWYSRTDKFAPESFLTRTRRLSRDGDVFREIVNVGRYAAVIMAKRVHLLYLGVDLLGNIDLLVDTVSQLGDGTPWDRSVVVFGMNVIWAAPDGPRIMAVSNAVGDDGHRGRIGMLDPDDGMRQWFEDAYEAGQEIDAGVDSHNGTIRFRRALDSNTFQVAQLSVRTRKWTLLDDDSGFAYVNTRNAGLTAEPDELLYSMTKEGAAFEVNYYGLTHPYDDKTVQDITDDTYKVNFQKIEKAGLFTADMLGDIVRFRSDNADIDGLSRVITGATADKIEFDTIDGLTVGDEFIIGANRFRIRFAAVNGSFRSNVKVVEGVKVKALPGPRNESGPWPDPPPGKFTLRLYRDYGQILETGREQVREIEVFDSDDLAHDTEDRVSSVEGDGAALQLELEMTDARTDFRIEMIEMQLREEGHRVEDASAES